jgi:uncharacterized membrane protein YraQ (UPF0718 family)
MKKIIRNYLISVIVIAIFITVLFVFPQNKNSIIDNSINYFLEMMLILPAVMILMGLFNVWVSEKSVANYLGKQSGVKGFLISVFLGALPTGPLYVAFPLASSMIKKGASISNIVIFLSAWACLKIPQELVELQFLGWKFMVLRWVFTVVLVVIMGVIIEKIIDRTSIVENV